MQLALCSDKLANMREPVALVMFTVRNADGTEKQVPVEFSSGDLDRFLAQGEGVYQVGFVVCDDMEGWLLTDDVMATVGTEINH